MVSLDSGAFESGDGTMTDRVSPVCIMAVAVAASLPTATTRAQLAFTDQTSAAGISGGYFPHDQFGLFGEMTGGGCVGDFNRDGWPDLFLLSGGSAPDRLYINNGDGTFSDHAAAWGVDLAHRGAGAAVGDYNNDGLPDLYVTSHGPMTSGAVPDASILYRNNGDGTFTDVAIEAGVNVVSSGIDGFSPVFGDYDLDGDLDLFVATWSTAPDGNRLFRNNGDGTFTHVNAIIGLDTSGIRGFTPVFADLNNDRYPELLITGDFETSRIFLNNADGTFTRLTRQQSGITFDHNAMGQTVADLNGDGLLDWFVSNIWWAPPADACGQTLYINQGDMTFVDVAPEAGVENGGWGWGTEAVDLDNDGDLDLPQTNGWKTYVPTPARLFLNNGDNTFTDIAATCGFTHQGQGRGLLHMDYDRDGDIDLVLMPNAEDAILYRNDLTGPGTNFLRIDLDTSRHPCLAPDGFGTWIHVTVGPTTHHRFVDGGPSFLGVGELTEHIGLGAATQADRIEVVWADGSTTVLTNVSANQQITIAATHPADLTGDGSIDVGDFFAFVSAFASGDPAADVNRDGAVDVGDFFAFVLLFAQPCG